MAKQEKKTFQYKRQRITHMFKYIFYRVLFWTVATLFVSFYFPSELKFFFDSYFDVWLWVLVSIFIFSYFVKTNRRWAYEFIEETASQINSHYSTAEQRKHAFNVQYRFYQSISDREKVALDLYKAFSPVPIVVFVLTYIQKLFPSLENITLDFNLAPDFVKQNYLIVFILTCILYYFWRTFAAWGNYNLASTRMYEFLVRLENAQDAKEESSDQIIEQYFPESVTVSDVEISDLSKPFGTIQNPNKDKNST